MKYTEASARLNEIVQKMQSEEVSIDELPILVKEAKELIAICRTKLRDISEAIEDELKK